MSGKFINDHGSFFLGLSNFVPLSPFPVFSQKLLRMASSSKARLSVIRFIAHFLFAIDPNPYNLTRLTFAEGGTY